MAGVEQDKPFLVTIEGHCSYCLLDPPSDNTRIVRDIVNSLKQSCDVALLTDHAMLRALVDNAIKAIQEYFKKYQQIQIASQCNQVMKQAEISAVYLAHLQTSVNFVVSNQYYAMRCLFYHHPPMELEGKNNLCWIANVASTIAAIANKVARSCKKSAQVVLEVVSLMHQKKGITNTHEAPDELTETQTFAKREQKDISALSNLINKSAIFWETVGTHCTELKVLACQINTTAKLYPMPADKFEQFKQQVTKASAGWIALGKVCSAYLNRIPSKLLKYVKNMLPCSTSFEHFAKNLDIHLEVVNSTLKGKDYEMQDELKVYSTWVRPVSSGGAKCLEAAKVVVDLFHEGNAMKAEKAIVDLKLQSEIVAAMSEMLARKLEALEPYWVYQQEKLMPVVADLEEEIKHKVFEKIQLQMEIAKEESNIYRYRKLKENAERDRRDAEVKRREAEEHITLAKKWWWVPVYGQYLYISDVMQNNQVIERQEAEKITDFQSQDNTLESNVQNARSRISAFRGKTALLNSQITNLKAEYDSHFQKLQELKIATAYLKETVTFWKGFVSATQHGENQAHCLARLIEQANREDDPDLIFKSKNSAIAAKSFSQAWEHVERFTVEGESRVIAFNFVCAVCQKSLRGLPMPVDENNVVCNECAHTLIE